jgi:uncharacterized protein (TIGR02001 family)
MMKHKGLFMGLAALAVVGLFAMPLQAQNKVNTGSVNLSVSFDITTHYLYRGISQENQGLIFQPGIDVSFGVTDNTSINFGVWNSLHSNQTGAAAGAGADSFYESDLYVGVTHVMDDFEISVTYTALTSPNAAFGTVEELGFGVSYAHDLNPSATLVFELDGQSDGGTDEGTFIELAIAPDIPLGDDSSISLSVPIALGLSLDDYYEAGGDDDTFGYFDVGVDASMDLSDVPAEYGSWSLNAGLHVIFLGNNAAAIGGGDTAKDYLVLNLGLGIDY